MSEIWVRMSNATPDNIARWDIELEWILAHKFIVGVRVNVGFSHGTGIAASPSSPNYQYIEYILRRLAAAGLKVQVGVGGEGPPRASAWRDLNKNGGGVAQTWIDVKRPPVGTTAGGVANDGIVDACRTIMNGVIARMYGIYKASGLDPHTHCFIELWNEPAVGGAGAPGSDSDGVAWYTATGLDRVADAGLWDSPAETSALTVNQGASFLEFFTKLCEGLETLGLVCVSPSFTCQNLFDDGGGANFYELDTFDRAVGGKFWIDLIRSGFDTVSDPTALVPGSTLYFSASFYFNAFSLGSTGCRDELYVWPSLGPRRYAEYAVWGFDGAGGKGYDNDCIAMKVTKMREHSRIRGAKIVVNEAGIRPNFMGMTDDPTTNTVGVMDQNYFENYYQIGKAMLAYLEELAKLGTERQIHFAITNTGTAWSERFGIFKSTIDIVTSLGNLSTYQSLVTFSSSLAWAEAAGLPIIGVAGAYGNAFWGKSIDRGFDESLPNYG